MRPAPSAIEVSRGKTTNQASHGKMTNETPVLTNQPKLPQYGDIESASDRRRAIIDQLRAMGVPNDVLALVARWIAKCSGIAALKNATGIPDKMGAVQLEMDMSKDAEMRAALGEEGFKQWDQKNMLWEAMSTEVEVTASETAAIYDLKKKLQQCKFDVEQARLDGTMDDAEINDAYDEAYSEYNQQLKAVLGDDRYAKSQQTDEAFSRGQFAAPAGQRGPE